MKRATFLSISLAALLLCCCAVPAGAVLLEVTSKGTVMNLSQANNQFTIQNPLQYGCSYPATGAPVCTWTPMTVTALSGTAPDAAAFTVFSPSDTVIATSIGGPGGTWISLAKLYGPGKDGEYVTDIVGNLDSVPTPLIGNYVIDATTVPDCGKCTGTTCTALYSDVKLRSGALLVTERNLTPNSSFTYNGRNDGSSVAVTFVNGQALSGSCPGKAGMTGPQAISVYVVKVVPPIGFGMTQQVSASPTSTAVLTTVPMTTQKAGTLPFAVIGALGVLGMIGFCMKRR
jgi:hypothetical protein